MSSPKNNIPEVATAGEQWWPGKQVEGVTEVVHDPGDGSTKSSGYGYCGDKVVNPGDWITMREETTSEHIARDIREGRFPKRSDPQKIAEVSSTLTGRQQMITTDQLDELQFGRILRKGRSLADENARLKQALQKIADLPTRPAKYGHEKNKPDTRERARRIAIAALRSAH